MAQRQLLRRLQALLHGTPLALGDTVQAHHVQYVSARTVIVCSIRIAGGVLVIPFRQLMHAHQPGDDGHVREVARHLKRRPAADRQIEPA